MSVAVYIDGQPAEEFATYRMALEALGPAPDESQQVFELWTAPPKDDAAPRSVWLNPPLSAPWRDWLMAGGAIVKSSIVAGEAQDRLCWGRSAVRVRSALHGPLDPAVLAAFLAQDFPLVDALMLARAFRGEGWPYDLSAYPVPADGPKCDAPFAEFPRHAGLYAVVPTSEWVRRLAEVNLPVVQLRDKRTAHTEFALNIQQAIRAVSGTPTRLFINDHWQLAIEHGAYGVHLGQEDIGTADLNAMQRAGLRLGISTHGIYEMLRAHACRPSYLALGAIFATATKTMATSPQGLRRLRHYVRLMSPHYPLVAIGGLDLTRIARVWATGVDCAAVLRAIVDAADYRRAASDLLDATPMNHEAGA